ncbi:DUF58 domain-containing protein [Undibacterium seohonense]|uniref:DUF58 domain-containing protein n=1 Tax=Undibacterium seohonense TaxID=1344950 RepID=A0ABR6X415_9BURK|nr:DUF58 domain-containing protein [Undibacterium seohonense]MBC3807585.1 DUF58 domain-containing protein [Undibacterium seohonense]
MLYLKKLRTQFKRIVLLEKSAESGEVILKQRRVFTLPSRAGLAFVLLLVMLFLTSTNYNLNLGFGMTYLLAGLAAVNALYTFRNLAYLRLQAGQGESIFAGDVAEFPIHIKNPQNLDRYAIHINFLHEQSPEQIFDVGANDSLSIKLRTLSSRRGYLSCPRIRLQTWFPLGLLRAWSTWLPATTILVFPSPEATPPPLPVGIDNASDNNSSQSTGHEDFAGVRSYQSGDPFKHLSWKHIARVDLDAGGALISKQFAGASGGEVCLDFALISSQIDLELRLSRMTSWILEAERQQLDYGFKLGNLNFSPAQGEIHRNTCLTALATYGLDQHHA